MSEKIKDGGPAYPIPVEADVDCHGRYANGYGGMSLRDWFAGMALQGYTANPETCSRLDNVTTAKLSYEAADAMLKARGVID